MSSKEDGPQYTPESNATDRRIAVANSPDISKLHPVKINKSLTIFITDRKLNENGIAYYEEM